MIASQFNFDNDWSINMTDGSEWIVMNFSLFLWVGVRSILIQDSPSGLLIHKGLKMQCPCGAEVQDRTHEVKTLRGAKEWLPTFNDNEIEFHLPVLIEQKECPKCGRYGFKVWGKKIGSTRFDNLLHSRI